MSAADPIPYLSAEKSRHGKPRLYVRKHGRRVRLTSPKESQGFAREYAEAIKALDGLKLAPKPPAPTPESKAISRRVEAARRAGLSIIGIGSDGTVLTKSAHASGRATKRGEIVYIIGYGEWVKIGFTKNLETRLLDLQCACPEPLVVLNTFPGGRQTERDLHKRFHSYRNIGEWFRREGEVAAWIESGCPL